MRIFIRRNLAKILHGHAMSSVAAFMGSILFTSVALANPVVDNVAHGNVSIVQTPTTTTVNQSSSHAVINWKNFNIGQGEQTHFQQPTGGAALNRINANQGATQIYGRLTATGRIILTNSAGIFFGPSAYVNVGGIVASTSDITDSDFLSGNYRFDQISPTSGMIINQGTIIAAQHGLVALMGNGVQNDGMIEAELGKVVMASGEKFTMSFAGNDLISFTVDGEAANGVTNTGTLSAHGGTIMVKASTAANMLDHAINMGGNADARAAYQSGGAIILSGGAHGKVRVSGKLNASGKANHQRGGNISITGKNILLNELALLDVSGDIGGGTVYVGGNYQGKGPLPNADQVDMKHGAMINADALLTGNGGEVILWSDNNTNVAGTISVRGGLQSGNGGFIETSGKNKLEVNGISVVLNAVFGAAGTWLLDPSDITISASSDSNVTGGSPFQPSTQASNSILNITTLTNALASGNVTVQTTAGAGPGLGDITVATPINWSSTSTLLLDAVNNIAINAGITAANGTLQLRAGTSTNTILTSDAGAIGVKNFNLLRGQWTQVVGQNGLTALPAFSVSNNFQIDSGTMPSVNSRFLRVAGGDGNSLSTPYLISDLYGLQGIGSDSVMLTNRFYKLTNNIDATSTLNWNSGAGFVPIGEFVALAFSNSQFNGQSFTISNLYINRPALRGVGLFGIVANGSVVKNLQLANVNITGQRSIGALAGFVGLTVLLGTTIDNITASGTVTSPSLATDSRVGGIFGQSFGTVTDRNNISNVSSSVTVAGNLSVVGGIGGLISNTTLSNAFNTGNVSGLSTGAFHVSGVVGFVQVNSIINSSYNTGAITGLTNNVAGIAAFASASTISNSYNTGAISGGGVNVGGVVGGMSGGSITNAYNTGSVTTTGTNGGLGGIVGNASGGATISNSYNLGSVSANINKLGGVVGEATSITLTNVYNAGSVTGGGSIALAVGGLVGQASGAVTLNSSYNVGTITSNANGSWVGGVVGRVNAISTLTNVYNAGAVIGTGTNETVGGLIGLTVANTTITNAYQSGYPLTLLSAYGIGGLIGDNTASATLTNVYFDTGASGQVYAIGRGTNTTGASNTASMMSAASYTGWSGFNTNWGIINNQSYPYLKAFYTDPRVVSGTSLAANDTINILQNGTVTSSTKSGANSFFYFLTGMNNISGSNNYIADNTNFLVYISGGSTKANVALAAPTSNASILGLAFTPDTIIVGSDNYTSTVSNSGLAGAKGSIGSSDVLYTKSGNNISVNNNVNVVAKSTTTYVIDGDFNLSGDGSVTFNGPVAVNSTGRTLSVQNASSATFNAGISGSALTLAGGSGTNLLTIKQPSLMTWNITGANAGNGDNVYFSSIENIIAGNNGNHFNFTNPGSISGTINAGSLLATNKLTLSGYAANIGVQLSSIENGNGTVISTTPVATFLNIGNLQQNPAANSASLTLPGNQAQVIVTSARNGSIDNTMNFTGFNRLISQSPYAKVKFYVPTAIDLTTSSAIVTGVKMYFTNFDLAAATQSNYQVTVTNVVAQQFVGLQSFDNTPIANVKNANAQNKGSLVMENIDSIASDHNASLSDVGNVLTFY